MLENNMIHFKKHHKTVVIVTVIFDWIIPVPFLGHCLHGDPQAFPNEQQHVDLR
jgi:hypothetical protein